MKMRSVESKDINPLKIVDKVTKFYESQILKTNNSNWYCDSLTMTFLNKNVYYLIDE